MPKLSDIHSPDALVRANIKLLNDNHEFGADLIEATHREVDAIRAKAGLPPFDWNQHRREFIAKREARGWKRHVFTRKHYETAMENITRWNQRRKMRKGA